MLSATAILLSLSTSRFCNRSSRQHQYPAPFNCCWEANLSNPSDKRWPWGDAHAGAAPETLKRRVRRAPRWLVLNADGITLARSYAMRATAIHLVPGWLATRYERVN